MFYHNIESRKKLYGNLHPKVAEIYEIIGKI